ncbi:hypothetical protein CYMTET_29757 [Cymbomonas tetramitiformis]|uniref:Uncharacterized protein n=1 Tax=Cymbomonas tetramitiformis TaxID=36881 RepID=A0AAE0KUM4_9CHLO|nr:hypothetical protein CYMTET_29757 [Cymbomonas tetramitiformis]
MAIAARRAVVELVHGRSLLESRPVLVHWTDRSLEVVEQRCCMSAVFSRCACAPFCVAALCESSQACDILCGRCLRDRRSSHGEGTAEQATWLRQCGQVAEVRGSAGRGTRRNRAQSRRSSPVPPLRRSVPPWGVRRAGKKRALPIHDHDAALTQRGRGRVDVAAFMTDARPPSTSQLLCLNHRALSLLANETAALSTPPPGPRGAAWQMAAERQWIKQNGFCAQEMGGARHSLQRGARGPLPAISKLASPMYENGLNTPSRHASPLLSALNPPSTSFAPRSQELLRGTRGGPGHLSDRGPRRRDYQGTPKPGGAPNQASMSPAGLGWLMTDASYSPCFLKAPLHRSLRSLASPMDPHGRALAGPDESPAWRMLGKRGTAAARRLDVEGAPLAQPRAVGPQLPAHSLDEYLRYFNTS